MSVFAVVDPGTWFLGIAAMLTALGAIFGTGLTWRATQSSAKREELKAVRVSLYEEIDYWSAQVREARRAHERCERNLARVGHALVVAGIEMPALETDTDPPTTLRPPPDRGH